MASGTISGNLKGLYLDAMLLQDVVGFLHFFDLQFHAESRWLDCINGAHDNLEVWQLLNVPIQVET